MTKEHSTNGFKAVLFDKDGTLFNFNETWGHFCDLMFDTLAGDDELLKDRLAEVCGYDRSSRTFKTGSLIVNASADEVNEAWSGLLPDRSLEEIVNLNHEVYASLPVFPTCDLSDVMTGLRDLGLKLGVATRAEAAHRWVSISASETGA